MVAVCTPGERTNIFQRRVMQVDIAAEAAARKVTTIAKKFRAAPQRLYTKKYIKKYTKKPAKIFPQGRSPATPIARGTREEPL